MLWNRWSLPYFWHFYLGIRIWIYHVQILDFTNKWSVLREDLIYFYCFVGAVSVDSTSFCIHGRNWWIYIVFVYTFLIFWIIRYELESKIYYSKTRYYPKTWDYFYVTILHSNNPKNPKNIDQSSKSSILPLGPRRPVPYPILVPASTH